MLHSIMFFLTLSVSSPAPTACETYAPRLDGTVVTVCQGSDGSGHVVRTCDASGYCIGKL